MVTPTPLEEAVWAEVLDAYWLLSDLLNVLGDARSGDPSARDWVTSAGIEAFADVLYEAIPNLDIAREQVIAALERREGLEVPF